VDGPAGCKRGEGSTRGRASCCKPKTERERHSVGQAGGGGDHVGKHS